MSDDAGLDDMVNLANRELMESYRNDYKKCRSKQSEALDQSLVPVHVKSTRSEKVSINVVQAARDGDLKKVMELHAAGYSLLSINEEGQTALHWAAQQGHREIVKYLLASAPASILDMVDNERGHSALHKAALSKNRTISCMLVAAGATLTLADKPFGQTPRALAEEVGDSDLAIYLESQESFLKSNPCDPETDV